MKTIFKQVVIEGFASLCSPLTFNLDRKGIHLIKGAVGVGKTTIFNAICWCLYGKPLKDVNVDNLPTLPKYRTATYKGTRVIVTIQQGENIYEIARHIRFKGKTYGVTPKTKLLVFKASTGEKIDDHHLVTDELYKTDQQGYIDRLLGMTNRTFLNSVLFGQRLQRLLELSAAEKRKLFEQLFDLGFLQDAKKEALQKLSAAKTEVATAQSNQRIIEDSLQTLKRELSEAKERVKRAKKRQETEHQRLTKNIDTQKAQIKVTQTRIDELPAEDITELHSKLKKAKAKLEGRKQELRDAYEKVQNIRIERKVTAKGLESAQTLLSTATRVLENYKGSCGSCGRKLTASKIKSHKAELQADVVSKEQTVATIKQKQQELNEAYTQAQAEAEKIEVDKVTPAKRKVGQLTDRVNKSNATIKQSLQSTLEQQQTHLNALLRALNENATLEPTLSDFNSLEAKIREYEEALEKTKVTLEKAEAETSKYAFWNNKGFASGGVKSYVIGVMLDKLNEYIHQYASRIGMSIHFSIDLSKHSKPFVTKIIKDNVEMSYPMLSGGEQQLVNACVAFAMHDLVSTNVSFLGMDEIFEGLDADTVPYVFDFVRMKLDGSKTVYVITHQTTLDFQMTKEILVTKHNGLTIVK